MSMLPSRSGVRSAAMRLFAIALAAFAICGDFRSANAATVTKAEYSTDGGTSWTLIATGAPNAGVTAVGISAGGFTIGSLQSFVVNGSPATLSDLNTTNFTIVNTNSSPPPTSSVMLAVTTSGFDGPTAPSPNPSVLGWSTLSGNNNVGGLTAVTLQVYEGTGTTALPNITLGVLFNNVSENSPGAVFSDMSTAYVFTSLSAPFSLTQVFTITMNAGGLTAQVSGDTTLSPAPEPASMTLLGIGLAGMAGCGWRRRKSAANCETPATVA